MELIEGRFGRVEPRRRVGAYLHGLLAGLERKNGWTLAEHAGAVSPENGSISCGRDAASTCDTTEDHHRSGPVDLRDAP